MPETHRHGRRSALGVLTVLAMLVPAAPATAVERKTLTPATHKGRVAIHRGKILYRVRKLDPARVRWARVRAGARSRRIRPRTVRRAARIRRLRVRMTRAWMRRHRGVRKRRRAAKRSRVVVGLKLRAVRPPAPRRELRAAPQERAAPSRGEACPAYGSFGAGRWPGACWRPYSDSSPFNQRLPASPQLSPSSSSVVDRLLDWGPPQHLMAGHSDGNDDYMHPLYYSRSGDPTFTIRCTMYDCPSIEGHSIAIPDAARPASGDDAHMAVIDQATGWEYDFWGVHSKPAGGGTIEILSGGRTRIDGDGLGSNATAAHFGLAAGVIRAEEMEAGRIEHALFMSVRCVDGTRVYPAAGMGSICSDRGESDAGAPPLGARFMLDMSAGEIAALAAPRWKKTILTAMAEYGMYVGDTIGGGASWGIWTESGASYTSFGAEDRWDPFSRSVGAPEWDGGYVLDIRQGVDWSRLRVVHPCVSQSSC
ncbi:MAG: hypothetical protein ACRDL0_10290 [Thermoleophilaceae bacterium]